MEIHYTWEIEGFSSKTEQLLSPVFSGVWGGELYEWVLDLRPNDSYCNCNSHVGVYLRLLTCDIAETMMWSRLTLIDALDVKLEEGGSGKISSDKFSRAASSWGWPEFLKRADMFSKEKRILCNGNTLRIHCCVSNKPLAIECSHFLTIDLPDEHLDPGLWDQYQRQKHTDLTIRVGLTISKDFKVHKCVFTARSDVFNAMFEHDLKEKTTNVVVIEDIEPDVFEEFVRFIYLGTVERMSKFDLDLLTSAEKYNLKRLTALCVHSISKTLSVATAVDILMAAHLNNVPSLKARALLYIAKNLKEILKTSGWKRLRNNDDLVDAVFEKLSEIVL